MEDYGFADKRREENYRLDLFFELSSDCLCVAGFDGYFKKVNPAFIKLMGYSEKELFSKSIDDFVFPEDREQTARSRDNLRRNKPLMHFENRYVTKSGDVVWLYWTSVPQPDSKLVYAIAKDITHQKKMEEERNLLLNNLSSINQSLKEHSYTTSHDLRSPVNNLIAVFDHMDTNKIEDEETRQLIDMLKISTEVLKNSLNQSIEEIDKQISSKVITQIVNFNEALVQVTRSIKSLLENANASVLSEFSQFENVLFNKSYLESILLNFITNSIKYSRHGVTPIIRIYSQIQNGEKQLVYEDNGIGIDMSKAKDRIFGLHQTFHNRSDSKGIGLYLVYNHVTSLGGNIKVESEVNMGTRFIITFAD